MFGSDWPLSSQLLAYTDVVALTDQLVTESGLAEVDAFWAHTAERFYGARAPPCDADSLGSTAVVVTAPQAQRPSKETDHG